MRTILLVCVAALGAAGCNGFGCGGVANGHYDAGECGMHTTFLAVRSHGARPFASTRPPPSASTKS
ncbi:MAG TPA: hypothetical protein VKU90_00290 [Caulobacteraceae bacterium]|jgi:hypothetical protein|nr:hypothetical protein [Caulobacteraceae bacterium]